MIWIISIVSIIMASIFVLLGIIDILNENDIGKKYKIAAFFILIKYLFIYPYIKLPFIINQNKKLFGINDFDDKGHKKSMKQSILEVLAVRKCILKDINSDYSEYIINMIKLLKIVIKQYKQKENKVVLTLLIPKQSMIDIFLKKISSSLIGKNENCRLHMNA